jgi:hypothetical protein
VQPTSDNPWPHPWPDSVPLTPCPALPLTEPLRERLRRIREHQMSEHRSGRPQLVCGVFYEEEVVCLQAGGGHAAYFGTDGRVHYENYGEGMDKVILNDPRDVASAIVKCAGDIGMPELIDLLPARPANAFVCRLCGGTRWESPASTGDPDGRPWCCRRCRGLGWTYAELPYEPDGIAGGIK